MNEWQTSWNSSIGITLIEIKPTIGENLSVVRSIRKEDAFGRMRIGHKRVTRSYMFLGEEQPQCVGRNAPFTALSEIRNLYYQQLILEGINLT